MDLFVADDTRNRRPSREGMGPLVALGGIYVPGAAARDLERGLDALCQAHGFPAGEEFKWSPNRRLWMHANLVREQRQQFFLQALATARQAGVRAIVVVEDEHRSPASPRSQSHEEDVVTLFLERANNQLAATGTHALVVCDRPQRGGQAAEERFLTRTLATVASGTRYNLLDRIAVNVLSTPSHLVRLLQLADVVTGCTVAYVGGQVQFAPEVFAGVKPLLREEQGRIGGVGLKLHPDFRYANLYHWLLGDSHFVRGNAGHPYPLTGWPYADSADAP